MSNDTPTNTNRYVSGSFSAKLSNRPGSRCTAGKLSDNRRGVKPRPSLQLQRQPRPARLDVGEDGARRRLGVVTQTQRERGREIAEHSAIVAVDHDTDQVTRLAEHQVTPLGRNFAKHPGRDPVVEFHITGVALVDAEGRVAVTTII